METANVADAPWFLKPETHAVFRCLNREGFEARAVGGCVRNGLLGLPVADVDMATTAKPEDTLRLAAEAGIRTVPTGLAHGTVTLLVNAMPFEVTTLRYDVETFGRHATVAFGGDWETDARRRDFTVNALYAGMSGRVYDPVGGLQDLEARRVRFIGDASERIREDYLRILRFFRFSSDYAEGAFDPEGLSASIRERAGLDRLSRERVRAEIMRILVSRRAPDAVRVMDESGLLLLILGGVSRRLRFEQLCALEAALQERANWILRLAALAVFVEEDADRLGARLRLSTAETDDLRMLTRPDPKVDPASSENNLKASLYRFGPRLYRGRMLLAIAGHGGVIDDHARAALNLSQTWKLPKPPLSGSDLMERGWPAGPALGKALKSAEQHWIASGFTAGRDELLEWIGAPPSV